MGRPKKWKQPELPIPTNVDESDIDTLVHYYFEGDRHGYLVSFTRSFVKIRPIAAIGGQEPHCRNIPIHNVERIKEKY